MGQPRAERLSERCHAAAISDELAREIKADLSGPFGSGGKNVPVPISLFPVDMRDEVRRFEFYQAVATLASLIEGAKQSGQTSILSMFPVEISARMEIWQGYETMTMWLEVPIASVAGVLDQVRSRALEFVLEIEAENPGAGATATKEPPVPLTRADAIFNTVIYDSQVAIGPGATVNVTQGDLDSLMAFLEAQGVAVGDREALEAALEEDEGLGEHVKGWLGEMAAKTVSVGGAVAEKAAIGVIAAAVLKYLGIT
jgi:hypothetical protein